MSANCFSFWGTPVPLPGLDPGPLSQSHQMKIPGTTTGCIHIKSMT